MAQASRAFQQGDFARARDLAQTAADRQPANASVLQFLGIAQAQAGDPSQGLTTLKRAILLAPSDAALRLNAARAAIDAGAFAEVEDICRPIATTPAAQQVLAQASRLSGFAPEAVTRLAALVERQPDDPRVLNNYGNALLEVGRIDDAVEILEKASELAPGEPQVWLNLGRARSAARQFEAALAAFDRAVALSPQDADINVELGKSLLRYGRNEEALLRLSEAARQGRREAQVFVMIGICYAGMEQRTEAERAYRMALSVDPADTRAILNLALQMERENRVAELETLVGDAHDRGLQGAEIAYCDALIMRRKGDLEGAQSILENNNPEGLDSYVRDQLIGQIADRLGDSDKAFSAFAAMNEGMSLTPEALRFNGTEHGALVRQATAVITPGWYAKWRGGAPADGRSSPAFLGGFLRSGTTLLDTILMGHEGTEVREEQMMLARLEEAAPSIEGLPGLPPERIGAMRAAYFTELRAGGSVPPGKLVIDKFPLMTLRASHIHRAFPDARFIFALRHPCDVVLSCFMQSFRVTSAMSSFLTLENSARLYDAAMTHWDRAQAVMPLKVHTVRYEDMVLDLEGELRPLIDFLGLEWDEALLDHRKTAIDRGYIRTPSYSQVTEQVYTRSSGRWESYRKHMEPVLPILAPWIERYGYEPI